jgi:hypothetical protein
VCIEDIAHGLANIGRFGGHTLVFYSVCNHSVWVSEHCENFPLEGLLHDATEAYLGDMVRPLKIFMPDYRVAEAFVWQAICEKFDLRFKLPAEVKQADNLALVTERRDFMRPSPHLWAPELEAIAPDPDCIVAHPPDVARARFLCQFNQLVGN